MRGGSIPGLWKMKTVVTNITYSVVGFTTEGMVGRTNPTVVPQAVRIKLNGKGRAG